MLFSKNHSIDKTTRNILYFGVSIGISVVLASCATSNHAKPPASWEGNKWSSTQSCIDISGIYRNLGDDAPSNKEKSFHRKHPQYLTSFFTPFLENGGKHQWITHVKITGATQGSIRIVFKMQNKVIETIDLKQKKDFACTEKGIEIKETSSMNYNIASLGDIRTNTIVFNKNNDGSLIVKEEENEKGIAVILIVPMPYMESTIQWYRFPVMQELP